MCPVLPVCACLYCCINVKWSKCQEHPLFYLNGVIFRKKGRRIRQLQEQRWRGDGAMTEADREDDWLRREGVTLWRDNQKNSCTGSHRNDSAVIELRSWLVLTCIRLCMFVCVCDCNSITLWQGCWSIARQSTLKLCNRKDICVLFTGIIHKGYCCHSHYL